MESRTRRRVCVVGAGAAGLCAARHLAASPATYELLVYERQGDLGGTWSYTERVGRDDDGMPVHSSMYRDLRTNLPKEIMSFPDYPEMKGGDRSCVSHSVILDYLKDYATHFQLRQYIQFNTVVESIQLERSESESATDKWLVKVKNVKSSKTETSSFDAVMICNGHYFEPYTPPIPGLDEFKGQVMHSHDYRRPEDFVGKTVVLLGAASSGMDVAFELTASAARVYLSHNKDRLSTSQDLGFTEVPGIERFADGKFVLKDGTSLVADVLLYCTGYNFAYPFLDPSCGIRVEDNYVTPLYRHLINAEHPSMCIVGIPTLVVPFPLFHMQVQYFLSVLLEPSRLPGRQAMLDEGKLAGTTSKRHAHKIAEGQWAYNEALARDAGIPALPAYYELGYRAWADLRRTQPRRYKEYGLRVAADGQSVQVIEPAKG